MTADQINAAIAESIQWTGSYHHRPDYCGDLNAIDKAEETLTSNQWERHRLQRQVVRRAGKGGYRMSDTPETQEAVERWRQGKINIFDEMARLERERDEAKNEADELLWIISMCMDCSKTSAAMRRPPHE